MERFSIKRKYLPSVPSAVCPHQIPNFLIPHSYSAREGLLDLSDPNRDEMQPSRAVQAQNSTPAARFRFQTSSRLSSISEGHYKEFQFISLFTSQTIFEKFKPEAISNPKRNRKYQVQAQSLIFICLASIFCFLFKLPLPKSSLERYQSQVY